MVDVMQHAGILLPLYSVLCTLADSHEADLSVYGNVFVRPLSTSSSTSSGRRRLQQTGTPAAFNVLHTLPLIVCQLKM